jgi:hypothetical protein
MEVDLSESVRSKSYVCDFKKIIQNVKQQKETKQPRHENGIEYILQAYL